MQKESIKNNYDEKAEANNNQLQRQTSKTYQLKAFNNWIKAVLIQTQTKRMCKTIQKELDLSYISENNKILHVLDIGCGRGQDIQKWKLARVQYMVAIDFSEECVKAYEQRWKNSREPYRLHTVVQDFTKNTLYYQINHSFYDIISAQFCFHYMFDTKQGLTNGLTAILSNLLIDGVFIATIPDSYTIIKKIEQKGVYQKDGSKVYGNKYFSIKFSKTDFNSPYGNMYGFYLQDAVGKKLEDGSIQYTNQWLIDLDSLSQQFARLGVEIQETMNFLEYFKKYRIDYKQLFARFKLVFQPGKSMQDELWEIVHLYRVLICKKKSKGRFIRQFNIKDRQQSIIKEVRSSKNFSRPNSFSNDSRNYNRGRNSGYDQNHSRSREDKYYNNKPRKF